MKLIVAQNSIRLPSFRGRVYLDPGVYAASLGSALQFDVQRAGYIKPITLTQVIYRPGGGTTTRSLPGSLLDGFNGLRDFLRPTATSTIMVGQGTTSHSRAATSGGRGGAILPAPLPAGSRAGGTRRPGHRGFRAAAGRAAVSQVELSAGTIDYQDTGDGPRSSSCTD